uniref:CS domain-containing protein n=1 Tax=Globisporangium ultimum (strain ATCC 200006 / CBS 805.95 / DAOM BR144) TaxID=431595 RepID=K3WUT5_GLOUD
MPLTPRFTWEQDARSVALEISLPAGALRHADVYVSDLVVKVNAPPYVLLLDLFDCVDDASVVVKADGSAHALHVSVHKRDAVKWPTLVCNESKDVRRERRQASMERKMQSEAVLAEKRRDIKYQEEKQTLRAQMAVDDTNRQILSDLKAEEKQREEVTSFAPARCAMRALYESFRSLQMSKQAEQQHEQEQAPAKTAPTTPSVHHRSKKKVSFADEVVDAKRHARGQIEQQYKADTECHEEQVLELTEDGSFDLPATTASRTTQRSAEQQQREALAECKQQERGSRADEDEHDFMDGGDGDDSGAAATLRSAMRPPPPSSAKKQPPVVVKCVPAPRETLHSEIQFTPRVFPTPSRESKAAEEEDWLLKNRKHLNKHQGLRHAGSYDISESDPMWLKAKGDDFYRSKDYQSAVNAYSEAISLASDESDLKIACLSNRAASHLQLANFEGCIADCSKALSFIPDTRDPAGSAATDGGNNNVVAQHRMKLKLFVRRGTAYCRIGKHTEAKADYGVALSMDNQNPTLQDDFLQLVAMEKAQELKESGDRCFRGQQIEQAITHYSDSLRLNPLSIACLSNRAACYLLQHATRECVADCTQALALLQQDTTDEKQGREQHVGLAFFSAGPAPGSAKRRAWVLKTLVRRGTAYAAMKDWELAEVDYAASVELDPTNEALQADLANVQHEKAKMVDARSGTSGRSGFTNKVASAC